MRSTEEFERLENTTLRGNILYLLTDAILSGRITPGERLNESRLARELQVSRAPIREALHQLEEQGLVRNNPRRGMSVVNLKEQDVQKINSVRLVLESEALRLCRANLNRKNEIRLLKLIKKMQRADMRGGGEDPPELNQLDLEFHRTLWNLAGNEYLERTLNGLIQPLFIHAVITAMAYRNFSLSESHTPLLQFAQGRINRPAEELVMEHLSLGWSQPGSFSSFAPRVSSHVDYFPSRDLTHARRLLRKRRRRLK